MWISFTLRDGRIGVCHESDIKSAAADPGFTFAKVQFRDGVEDEIVDATSHDTLGDALAVMFAAMEPRSCRICGCTDDDCSGCIAKTGEPCSWVEDDLCSACVGDAIAASGGLTADEANRQHDQAEEIEKRVRATIRESKGDDGAPIVERIISDADFETLLQLSRRSARQDQTDDPREPDGFPAPTGDGTRDLQRINAHLARTASGALSAAEANHLHDKADVPVPTAAEKLAALPETRQLPIARGQGLSPLQDGNHPEIEAHRKRLGEASGDPMASAKALLARNEFPGDDGECEACGRNHFAGDCES